MQAGDKVVLKSGHEVVFVETIKSQKDIDVHYFSHPEWGDNFLSLTSAELEYNRRA